ncbi:MAG: sigma factor-like helix-turn-helix DNA-binding protein [Acidobacteriaceae bacterium]
MSDYALSLKIRNGRIRRRITECGYRTVSELCRQNGLSPSAVGEILNLKQPPLNKNGTWAKVVVDLAEVLTCEPDDLFNAAQRTMALERNGAEIYVTERDILAITAREWREQQLLAQENEYRNIEDDQVRAKLLPLLSQNLPPREFQIIQRLYGIGSKEECDTSASVHEETLKKVAEEFHVSKAGVRQIEGRALRRLRYPSVAKKFRELC